MSTERQNDNAKKKASDPVSINVGIVNNQTNQTQRANLQEDVTLQELTNALVGTPLISRGSESDGFTFENMRTGEAMPMNVPIRELGIREGDELRITPGLTVA